MRLFLIVVTSVALLSCKDDKAAAEDDPAARLNDWIKSQYPDGHPASDSEAPVPATPEDEMEEVSPMDVTTMFDGHVTTSTADTTEADGTIASMCVGFGDPADAWCVPTTNEDVVLSDTDGDGSTDSASLLFDMPPELCEGLSEICHDIRCYEFAQTEFGNFTAANVQYMAAACGQCDEPSCQDLLQECSMEGACLKDSDCGEEESCFYGVCVGEGQLRFSLSWAGQTDFDFYVETPNGEVLGFSGSSAAGGGIWDHDSTGGVNNVENIYFDTPSPGVYTFWVNLYSGSGGAWTIQVMEGSTVQVSQTGSLGDGESERYTYTAE